MPSAITNRGKMVNVIGTNKTFFSNRPGFARWAARIAGTGNDAGYGISSDGSGNTCVTGFYSSSPVTIYNADGSTFGTLTNSGGPDAFVVKYNSAGTAQWVTTIAGSSTDIGFDVSMDSSGNIYVTGFYYLPVTIYNADGSTFGTIANSGGADAFVVKYNSTGMAQWGTHIGGSGDDLGYSINAGVNGNIYVTGYGNSAMTIYNADGSTFGTLPNSGDNDVFIVKYT